MAKLINLLYIYNYMREVAEKILNMIVLPKYPLLDRIEVKQDDEYDITTYKIFVIANKYDAIHDRDNVVKDIENVLKSLGIKRRDLENIIFAMDA